MKTLSATRLALLCGVVAGPLFVFAAAVEGSVRADYDPMRHPVSSLALSEYGWTQTANFLVAGVLYLAYAAGFRTALKPGRGRLWGPILLALFGVGLFGSGLFTTDPVSGYPPGSPASVTDPTTAGTLHDLFALPVFIGLPVLCVILAVRFIGERRTGWAVYTLVTAASFVAGFFAASTGFAQEPGLVELGGLFQRITIVLGLAWLTSLAVHLLRVPSQR